MSAAIDDNVIHGEWHVRYNYSVGKVAGHFFEGLKQRKILASHCSASGIAYLPPRAEYAHALIAAFGIPTEPDPGELTIADSAVRGVHITRLAPDGTDRERTDNRDKIIVGRCVGTPVVLAPPNDRMTCSAS